MNLGIGVSNFVVESVTNNIVCVVIKTSFSYLGLTAGGDMKQLDAWIDIA